MMYHFSQTRPSDKGGFTLVETLVAITVLLLVIIGPITVAQKGIQSSLYANEQVTAVFLAQEAVEAIREHRDSQALDAYESTQPSDNTWTWMNNAAKIHSDCSTASGCAYNVVSGNFESCGSNNSCRLRMNSTTGKYSYENGVNDSPSPYTRKVYINTGTPGALSIRVDVVWDSSLFGSTPTRTIMLETWLYDHYRRYDDQP